MNSIKLLAFAVTITLVSTNLYADVRLANIFGDNMVLQRDQELKIFGWGDPGNPVEVQLRDQSVTVKVDEYGRWLATLKPIQVGGPFDIAVVGINNTVVIKNCLAGEVWICSGQSNMEWTVNNSKNPQEEIAAANYSMIRHCDVVNRIGESEQNDVETTGWKICSPETAGQFTAVGYYFGRELHQQLDVPIGLINSTWGGTIVEAWTSGAALKTHPDFQQRMAKIDEVNKTLDTKMKMHEDLIKAWDASFQAALEDRSDSWQFKDLDDSAWKEIDAPRRWENAGYRQLDGIAWYRKSIEIPDGWAGSELTLSLAKIDDQDKTWVNGQLVGETKNYAEDRVYKVPANLVHEGDMSITVCVTDTGGSGGIFGDKNAMKLIHPTQEFVSLDGKWKFKVGTKTAELSPRPKTPGFNGPNNPTALYNTMIHGLVPFAFQGAIWYQGESNASRAYQYQSLFPLMIEDWRHQWEREFPFYWVQLANFMKPVDEPGPSKWAELREAQSMALALPNTGEAVIIDIGEARDIHPKNKQDVGKRLALHALKNQYGKDLVHSGPRFKAMSVKGPKARLAFDHVGGGLVAKEGKLKRFEIAGEDKKFVWANAEIDGQDVVVWSDEVSAPVAVRYAWADNPQGCNLYNAEGIPASPFRTDDWPGITINAK